MPLNQGCSIRAFRDNISKMISEGRSQSQAVAIAVSTLRDSCKSQGKPVPDIGEEVQGMNLDQETMPDPERSTAVWKNFDYSK